MDGVYGDVLTGDGARRGSVAASKGTELNHEFSVDRCACCDAYVQQRLDVEGINSTVVSHCERLTPQVGCIYVPGPDLYLRVEL